MVYIGFGTIQFQVSSRGSWNVSSQKWRDYSMGTLVIFPKGCCESCLRYLITQIQYVYVLKLKVQFYMSEQSNLNGSSKGLF